MTKLEALKIRCLAGPVVDIPTGSVLPAIKEAEATINYAKEFMENIAKTTTDDLTRICAERYLKETEL